MIHDFDMSIHKKLFRDKIVVLEVLNPTIAVEMIV